jgi:hypothetical protein
MGELTWTRHYGEIKGLKFQEYGPFPQTVAEAIEHGWTALMVGLWKCEFRCEREGNLLFQQLADRGEQHCSLAWLYDSAVCRRCGRKPEFSHLGHRFRRGELVVWHRRAVHFMDGKAVSLGLAEGADIRRGAEKLPPDHKVPTVGQLFQEPGWLWIVCEKCNRFKPVRTQSLIQRWGRDTSSNVILRAMRCKRCQWKRARFQSPSWGGAQNQWASFPGNEFRDDEL